MTALNAFRSSDRVHLFTDGAFFDTKTGAIIAIANKVHLLPHYNAVVACAGYFALSIAVVDAICSSNLRTLADVLRNIEQLVRNGIEANRGNPGPGFQSKWGHTEVLIVSHKAIHVLTIDDVDRLQINLRSVDSYIAPTGNFHSRFVANDPVVSGLALMREQRGKICRVIGGGSAQPCHVLGGFAQHTETREDGITVRILERWPDKIGERIKQDKATA